MLKCFALLNAFTSMHLCLNLVLTIDFFFQSRIKCVRFPVGIVHRQLNLTYFPQPEVPLSLRDII